MPKKGSCATCKAIKFLTNPDETLCSLCSKPAMVPVQLEPPDLSMRNEGTQDAVISSLNYLKGLGVKAMYIGEMTQSSRSFGSLIPDDMPWATKVADVFASNFICNASGVFSGLIVFEGGDMVFSPPNSSSYASAHIAAPSISISSLADWNKKLGAGNQKDWTCVLCHEVIHYLHWRWTILPCPPQYNDKYEDEVSGQLQPGGCGIPWFVEKETNGKKELHSPPTPFTENGFRSKYGLSPRTSYSDLSRFGAL